MATSAGIGRETKQTSSRASNRPGSGVGVGWIGQSKRMPRPRALAWLLSQRTRFRWSHNGHIFCHRMWIRGSSEGALLLAMPPLLSAPDRTFLKDERWFLMPRSDGMDARVAVDTRRRRSLCLSSGTCNLSERASIVSWGLLGGRLSVILISKSADKTLELLLR